MRRMRDLTWHYYLLALPVIAIVVSAAFLAKDRYHDNAGHEALVAKPSGHLSAKPTVLQAIEQNSDFYEPGVRHAKADTVIRAAENQCASPEYAGFGPDNSKATKAQWAKLMDQFHDAKARLHGWIAQHRGQLPVETAAWMDNQVKELRIQRPPTPEEPDLSWRGIGVFTYDSKNAPIIRIGGGFLKLVEKNPKWSKFELVRLITQAWSPCELEKAKMTTAWTPFLKCLGVNESNGCADGSYSESGWAVSTSIASLVAGPGCSVPALANPEATACMTKLPLAAIAAGDVKEISKEARR